MVRAQEKGGMMDARKVMPGLDLSGFVIPAGNGFPELTVHLDDPANWVSMQIAARQPGSKIDPQGNEITETVTPAAPASLSDGVIEKLFSSKYLSDLLSGFAIKGGLVLLGLLVVAFGLYYLTRD